MAATVAPQHRTVAHVERTVFDPKLHQRLLDEDSAAWRSVTGILITIVAAALLIGIITVTVAR